MYEMEPQRDKQDIDCIEQNREGLFEEIYGIPFSWAKQMSTWDNEIGEHWRKVFNFLECEVILYERIQS